MNDYIERNRLLRVGVYGVAVAENCLLLTTKLSGPYQGKLDLPGGKIEFGEAPADALKREFREEVAMTFDTCTLWTNLSHVEVYSKDGANFELHHLGMIYINICCKPTVGLFPGEAFAWYRFEDLKLELLTPFAKASFQFLSGKSFGVS